MKKTSYLFARTCLALTCAAQLGAQSITVTARTTTSSSITATVGSTVQSAILSAGPLNALDSEDVTINQGGNQAYASVLWMNRAPTNDDRHDFLHQMTGGVASSVTAVANIEPHEILLEVVAPQPRQVVLEGNIQLEVSGQATAPIIEVDIGDDGTIEFSGTQPDFSAALVISTSPLLIRIRAAGSVATTSLQPSTFSTSTELVMRPDNRINIQTLVGSCSSIPLPLHEAFSTDGTSPTLRLLAPSS